MDSNRINEQDLSWRPTKRFGSKRSHPNIYRTSSDRLSIRLPWRSCIVGIAVVILGILIIKFQLWRLSSQLISFEQLIPALIIGSVFIFLGGKSVVEKRKPTIFDLKEGFMWKGKRNFYEADPDDCVHLSKVVGVQLLAKFVKAKNARFATMEINLVSEDQSRIHLADLGSKPKALAFANEIKDFLNVPLVKRLR